MIVVDAVGTAMITVVLDRTKVWDTAPEDGTLFGSIASVRLQKWQKWG